MASTASFDPAFLNIPVRSLVINGVALPVVVREATFSKGPFAHDSVKMSVLIEGTLLFDNRVRVTNDDGSTRVVDTSSLLEQPVTFIYGVSPRVDEFVGYIAAIEPDQKFKEPLNYQITMIGSTVLMQRVVRGFATYVTATEVVKQRCDRSWLGFDGVQTSYRWPSVGQTERTDWQMATAYSIVSGCILLSYGSIVRMVDPLTLLQRYPMTTLRKSDDLLENEREMLDFKPEEKSAAYYERQPVEAWFFDNSGNPVSARQDSSRTVARVPVAAPVMNREEAEIMVNASARALSRWAQTATARIRGDASIYPGVTVDVFTGSASTVSTFNGRWLVISVKHSMNREAFFTELSLSRPNGAPTTVGGSTFEHFWRTSPRGKPSSIIKEGRWLSTWADPRVSP